MTAIFGEEAVSDRSAAPAERRGALVQADPARVLIVDDEALIAWDLRAIVETFGHKVCGVAATGPDAIRLAEQHAPDLVLMDVRLRGEMDGIEAARRILDSEPVDIIFITGNSDSRTEARIKAVHPTAIVLSKPVMQAYLGAAIDGLLDRRRSADGA